MQDTTEKSGRDFQTIKKEIDDVNARLSLATHPESRRELMRQMRILLQELTDVSSSL